MKFKKTILLGLTILFSSQFANVHADIINFLKTVNFTKDAKEMAFIGSVLGSSLFLERMKTYPNLQDLAAILQITCGIAILKKSKDYYSFQPSMEYTEAQSADSSEEKEIKKHTWSATFINYMRNINNEIKKTKYSTVIVGSGIISGIGPIVYGLNNLIKNNQ